MLEGVVAHLPASGFEFGGDQNPGLAGLEEHVEPVAVVEACAVLVLPDAEGLLVDLVELVMASGGAHEHGPAQPIRELWADDQVEHGGVVLGVLVHDHAVHVQAPKAVRVVRTVKPNAVSAGQLAPQFGLVVLDSGQDSGELLDVAPGDVLGLRELRGDVGVAAVLLALGEGGLDEFVDGGNRLARPAVTDHACPALLPVMKGHECLSRRIGQDYFGRQGKSFDVAPAGSLVRLSPN